MMHAEPPSSGAGDTSIGGHIGPWYRGLTRYHWFVLFVAALGWLFDTMDQQLFNLARRPAMADLLATTDPAVINFYGSMSTSIFVIGWALGGLFFGILGDKIGRAKTMLLTILIYSLFTGLSAFSFGFWDFAFYRFLTGLGVGGEFAVGVALVAEVMPDYARARALGWLQTLSAVGNMTAALIVISLGLVEETGMARWRIMFLIGALPALLAIVIRLGLKEPERWQKTAGIKPGDKAGEADLTALPPEEPEYVPKPAEDIPPEDKPGVYDTEHREGEAGRKAEVPVGGHKLGSLSELFGDPRWRKNTIVGMLLAFAGVVGLWGIGFFSFDLIRDIFGTAAEDMARDQGLEAGTAAFENFKEQKLGQWTGYTSLVQNLGAFFGIYMFARITVVIGRKPAFAIAFTTAMIWTAFTFLFLGRIFGYWDVYWMIPIMGFFQLSIFGGYAIYFPELFPTRLRSTGTSFCYNVGRLVAAAGPAGLGLLNLLYAGYGEIDPSLPMRYAGVTMCSVFLIGLAVLPFAPETMNEPLPE